MKVILFRHGPAGSRNASRWPDDALRPLTTSGRERTLRAARGLVKLERRIDAVFTSPLARAEQTALLLAEALKCSKAPETMPHLQPGGPRRKVIEALGRMDVGASVVLVGHEPDLGKLAGMCVLGAPAPLPMKKAGACVIQFVGPVREGNGRLVGFYPPRVLRRFSDARSKT